MASDLEQLLEMGFEKERAELAMKKAGNLMGAIDWIQKTQDTPMDELLAEESEGPPVNAAPVAEGAVANSIVCNEEGCGQKFRTWDAAQFHASKTEHANFSESTEEIAPLTEAEKKARLEELREKSRLKKAGQAEVDKAEQKRNDQIRQKATRETQELKEEAARKEQIKEAAKKRREQNEDAEHKKRVRAQIEADKKERARKKEAEIAARDGRPDPSAVAAAAAPPSAPVSSSGMRQGGKARLLLMTSAGRFQKELEPEKTLGDLAQILQSEHGVTASRFKLDLRVPPGVVLDQKTVFETSDFETTLKDAKLAGSRVTVE